MFINGIRVMVNILVIRFSHIGILSLVDSEGSIIWPRLQMFYTFSYTIYRMAREIRMHSLEKSRNPRKLDGSQDKILPIAKSHHREIVFGLMNPLIFHF